MKKRWPFGFNVLLFAAYASVGPFFILYYQDLGFTGAQIGLLSGISPLITFVFAPLWTRFADRTLRHRLVMSLALLSAVAAFSVFPFLRAFAPILGISILLNSLLSPITPFADSAALYMLADHKELYGRIRLGGTIGYGVAAPIAGALVARYGLGAAFWTCAGLYLLTFLISRKLAYGPTKPAGGARGGRLRALVADPRWPLFLTVALLGGFALASFNYFFAYMKELGASESTMGLAITVGTLFEVPALFFGHRLIRRWSAHGVLLLAMVALGVRLLLFAACRTPGLVLLIQVTNGVTFPLMWVAGVSYAHEIAPEGMSTTAQGLFSATVYGFGMAAGGFLGGPLLESLGGRGLYLVFGLVTLALVGVVALVEARLSSARPDAQGTLVLSRRPAVALGRRHSLR